MTNVPSNPNRYPSTPNRYPSSASRYPASANLYPGAFTPASISGLVSWWTATNITDTGNGTAVSAMADAGPAGATLTEGGAGLGPLRRDATGRRAKSVQFSSGKYNTTTNATVVAVENGAASAWTIVRVTQPTLAGTSYYESWGHSSLTTRYAGERRENNQYRDQFVERDTVNNNNVGGLSASPIDHLTPQVQIFRMSVGSLQRRIDGVNQAAQPITRGAQNVDMFGLGALLTGAAPALLSGQLLSHYLLYTGALSDSDCARLETYFSGSVGKPGIGVGWKAGYTTAASFGNGSNAWLIVSVIGQSNGAGRGTTSGPAATSGMYCLYADGNLDVLADPTADPTNAVGGTSVDAGAATSMFVRTALRLRELGENRNIMIVDRCIGSTGSDSWASSLTTSPPIVNSPIGAAKHAFAEALKAPNAELVTVVYQGESNTSGSPTVAAWSTDWAAILNELNTFFGSAYVKTKRHFIVNLPPTAWTLSTSTNWADLRAAITTFCSVTRTDCVEVQAANGPWTDASFLHLETGSNSAGAETGLMATGIALANAIFAAT